MVLIQVKPDDCREQETGGNLSETGYHYFMNMKTEDKNADDYQTVCKVIETISDNWRSQPGLDELANSVGLSPFHLQRLFSRWAGISPKQFLQAITLDHARNMLKDSATLLDAAYETGLSGPGRLHDLFVSHEGMSPGLYKKKGEGLCINYGFHPCPFGTAIIMANETGLIGLAFADNGGETTAFEDMSARWPNAQFVHSQAFTAPYTEQIFGPSAANSGQPLRLTFIGTDFEIRVWETLLKIPMGRAVSYSDIASHIDRPRAVRAVGTAVGKNPLSFVVPCHRVLGKTGSLCGYHWGITRKKAILGWEKGQLSRI